MNVCESLSVSAGLFPDQVALIFRDQSLTYQELDELSRAAASVLLSKGLKPGERVAIQLGNCPAFPVWYYAVLRVGAIAVSLSTRLSVSERHFIVEDSGAGFLITVRDLAGSEPDSTQLTDQSIITLVVDAEGSTCDGKRMAYESDSIVPVYQARPDEAALILYTSGTTGFPKGATLSHSNVRSNVAAFNHLCNMHLGDRVLLAVPLFHCFGQNALLNSVLNVGGTLILQERFDLNESKRLIRDYNVNQLYGVPMMFQLMLQSCGQQDLESVTYCFSAAAPLSIATSRDWKAKFGIEIYEGYGLTETSPFASYNHRNRYQLGSIGMPIDAVEMKVCDPETGQTCKPGQLGEIAIRGPNVMLGYWNRPEETSEAIRDGWFFSGDLGKQDEAGFFYIVDRVKDMIAVGGMKVFPAEVERVLVTADGVEEAAVVGIEEPIMGEQVIGFLKLASGEDPAACIESAMNKARQELASYKTPRRLFSIETLPRNPSGKVLKTELRQLAIERLKTPASDNQTGQPEAELMNAGSGDASSPTEPQVTETQVTETQVTETQLTEPQSTTRILQPGIRARLAGKHPAERRDAVANAVSELVGMLMGEDELPTDDQTFLEIGMDSLMLVELGTQLQLELGSSEPLSPTLLFDYPRIGELADYLWDLIREESSNESDRVAARRDGNSATEPRLNQHQQNQHHQNQVSNVQELSEEEALQQLLKELDS